MNTTYVVKKENAPESDLGKSKYIRVCNRKMEKLKLFKKIAYYEINPAAFIILNIASIWTMNRIIIKILNFLGKIL